MLLLLGTSRDFVLTRKTLLEMMCKIRLVGVMVAVSLMLSSCGFNDDPHRNFQKFTNLNGYKLSTFEFFRTETPLSVRLLGSGNVEYRYKYPSRRTCVTVYEVDPDSGIVLHSSFEGGEMDCVWNP